MATPIGEFMKWLPGELEYSARKAGYDKKIERARLHPDNRLSLNGFVSQEWLDFQNMRNLGNVHQPFHGKSAQLNLAKFAGLFFDKTAMGIWCENGANASADAYVMAATATSELIMLHRPWQNLQANDEYFERILHKPFGDTIFGRNVHNVMNAIVEAADNPDNSKAVEKLITQSMALGGVALACYETFARNDLTTDQYILPISVLTT